LTLTWCGPRLGGERLGVNAVASELNAAVGMPVEIVGVRRGESVRIESRERRKADT
jgi:hypothetical protein